MHFRKHLKIMCIKFQHLKLHPAYRVKKYAFFMAHPVGYEMKSIKYKYKILKIKLKIKIFHCQFSEYVQPVIVGQVVGVELCR